ncbi:MAG: hypothetical protein GX121_07505 [Ignavibacteria bacterium]|nr:hypothetical protein [Ignavibacteria bacterium]
MNKEFSLFGTEWKKAKVINENNQKRIDWNYDLLTGFRWDSSQLGKKIKLNQGEGIDIKNIWELGRMQHLLIFPIASVLAQQEQKDSKVPNQYFEEFKSQILDFIQSNKYTYGVHWSVAMEAGIRATNWLIAFYVYKNAGFIADEIFNKVFEKSLFEHLLFICENLEWSNGIRGNHYLANIVAMLFLSAFLPTTEFTKKTLYFATQELCNEILVQFNEDGSNFEASLPYHYFSTEIVLAGLWLIFSLKENKIKDMLKVEPCRFIKKKKIQPFKKQLFSINKNNFSIDLNAALYERISKILDFSHNLLKSNGKAEQIGDNDSGFFISAEIEPFLKEFWEHLLLKISPPEIKQFYFYKDFGIFIKRTNQYFATIRCGSIGQRGKGGHSHNDQLSLTLNLFGVDFLVDPGTYSYTGQPKLRNLFRSTAYHNTLSIEGMEQNEWAENNLDDLFWFKTDRTKSKMIEYSEKHFIAEHYGFGKPHRREIFFHDDFIEGIDFCKIKGKKRVCFHLSPDILIAPIKEDDESSSGFFTAFRMTPPLKKGDKGDFQPPGFFTAFRMTPPLKKGDKGDFQPPGFFTAFRMTPPLKKGGRGDFSPSLKKGDKGDFQTSGFFTAFRMTPPLKKGGRGDFSALSDFEAVLTFTNGIGFIEEYNFSSGYNQMQKSKRIILEFEEEKLNWRLQFCKIEKKI